MSNGRIGSYAEFWQYYLREHARPATRAWHFAGISTAIVCLILLLAGQGWGWLIGALLAGYGPAWIAHHFVERNKPTSLRHPFWSFISDFRMFGLWVTGRLAAELKRAGVVVD